MLPCDGVGLARMEFIITEHIGAHPMALLHPQRIADPEVRAQVCARFRDHPDGAAYFVDQLAEGVGTIAAAFFPRPVIVRLSDFKSNEYAALTGGRDFEPVEENPMLGLRGAARYLHPDDAEAFALECAALRRVRDDMGMSNLKVMVPFCRRLDEARRVLAAMAGHGLARGRNGLQVYVMCEIPNNVVLIDEFAQLFDGFSIGSNDLTQLTLGVDRDSAIIADAFDESDPGVLRMIRLAVEGARRNGRHSGICGQAPSDSPEIVRFLVELGIDSISLSPDCLLRTMQEVRRVEQAQGRVTRAAPRWTPLMSGSSDLRAALAGGRI
jgi:pyruvate,water dikinase